MGVQLGYIFIVNYFRENRRPFSILPTLSHSAPQRDASLREAYKRCQWVEHCRRDHRSFYPACHSLPPIFP